MPIQRPYLARPVPSLIPPAASTRAAHLIDDDRDQIEASVYTLAPEAPLRSPSPRTPPSTRTFNGPADDGRASSVPADTALPHEDRARRGELSTQQALTAMLAVYGNDVHDYIAYEQLRTFVNNHSKVETCEFEQDICSAASRALTAQANWVENGEARTLSPGHPANVYALDLVGDTQPRTVKAWLALFWHATSVLPDLAKRDARSVLMGALAECEFDGRYLSTARQLQRILSYLKDYFPAQIAVVTPPLNAATYAIALDALVRGHLADGTSADLPTDTVALLHREAFDTWAQANAHDDVCYEEGYLTFDEAAARAVALQQALAHVMNDTYGLGWPVPELPNDDERLFGEARIQARAANPRDMQPTAWAESRVRHTRRRNLREMLVCASGMAAGVPFGPYAMLLSGQAAVHVERAVSGYPQDLRASAARAVGVSMGAMVGGPVTMMVAGSIAKKVDAKIVEVTPRVREATTGRAFAFLRALQVSSTWPRREQDAPLFVDDRSDDEEDAHLLTDWEVIARVRTRSR